MTETLQFSFDKPSDANTVAWQAFFNDIVMPYWQEHVQMFDLQRPHNVTLRYFLIQPDRAKGIVLLSPGRIEGAIKYPELVWELGQLGYAVAILDHRGQGFSDRLGPNRHNGHVEHFDDFVDDFAAFARAVEAVMHTKYPADLPVHVLAHSMGGAIAALYLARYPHKVKSAVLCSPMFGIQTGRIPHWAAVAFAHSGAFLNRLLTPRRPWYIFGTGDYVEVPFAHNELSHSAARYQMFRQLYQQHPEAQLGGPSFRWVAQALSASRRAIGEAGDIHIPVLVVQAGGDQVVDPQRQCEFVCALSHPKSRLQKVAGARHELLIESDDYRQPTVEAFLRWIQGEYR
ncbi:alpha/beta fold hydrolase [Pseudidiomarina insulisalsae]|uniref:Lysophospholipase n=1 Tax=Pseudidiomarina insulisalsae TaxID=575789 RepID=A0A432YQY1_9GAMM|nr:alpha/beta fold hydrolase [Pseudidiomarina insulisalsae]RUO63686.1 lysophospholipase [Pseudidiomarina insulisalsae]